ncbi:chaperonin 10-like protein [Ephemerocybe angulata]|uniref:Chaperonin 10-like protein n=1 Tax=Ephemerocybe angulata TaxID=980116 RepID=A0A8H6M8U4_9AGAR|nr:chaperonin 10-like protein [Tulosesus angulatus]
MATQKALVIPEQFKPFTVASLPIPRPGKQELLVKVKSAALNPADWKIQRFGVVFTSYPAVSGYDITGEVLSLGEGVEGFEIGDRVFFASEFNDKVYGGFQQYALADALTAAKIPSSISYDEASTLPASVSAAYVGLYDDIPRGLGLKSFVTSPGAYKGQAIFIIGGSGSVGQAAIQLARLSGFSHIITSSSSKHELYLKSLGATHVLDRSISPSEIKTAVAALSVPPNDYAFDAIGAGETTLVQALAALAPKGRVVTVEPGFEYKGDAETLGEKSISNFAALKTVGATPGHMSTLWPVMSSLLESKELLPQRYEVLPGGLEGIVAGLGRLERGEVSGVKLVVHPGETE